MGSLKWYKRDPRAALVGMMGLTLEERGAYNTLIDLIYIADGALPDDERAICKVLGTNGRGWKRIRTSLIAKGKIYLNDGRLHNERADFETSDAFDRATRKVERRRLAKVSGKFGQSFGKVSPNLDVSPELKQILSGFADHTTTPTPTKKDLKRKERAN